MQCPLKSASFGSTFNDYDTFDLDGLLHPAQAFEHPSHVVTDPDLTLNEKRAILASWASDACAIEAAPAFRRVPGGKRAVGFDEVIEALRTLDKARDQGKDSKCHRHILRRREGFERRAQYFIRRWTGTISQLDHLSTNEVWLLQKPIYSDRETTKKRPSSPSSRFGSRRVYLSAWDSVCQLPDRLTALAPITDKRLRKASAGERLMAPPVNQDEESFDASSRPETVTASLP